MKKLIVILAMVFAVTAIAQTSPAGGATKAVIRTSLGDIHCTLYPDQAPVGVANFVGLATGTKEWTDPISGQKKTGTPLYDNTVFHRVIPDFMIQGGDPKSHDTKRPDLGTGDPGYKFKNETTPELKFDRPGRLAYANAGPNTNGSQFFITSVAYPSLNGGYTIFGQCDDQVTVKQIAGVQRDPNDKPRMPVVIKHIEIVGAGAPKASGSSTTTGDNSTDKKPAKKTNK